MLHISGGAYFNFQHQSIWDWCWIKQILIDFKVRLPVVIPLKSRTHQHRLCQLLSARNDTISHYRWSISEPTVRFFRREGISLTHLVIEFTMFLKTKNIFEDLSTGFLFIHLIALLLFPMTALRCLVGITGDKDQKSYHTSEFAVMVLEPNFVSALNCLKCH